MFDSNFVIVQWPTVLPFCPKLSLVKLLTKHSIQSLKHSPLCADGLTHFEFLSIKDENE